MHEAEQIRAKADRAAAAYVAESGEKCNYYPALAGYLEGEIHDLVRQIRVLERQLARSNSEVNRLTPIEEAANQLLDALYQRGRGPAAGPNTTLEIEDATEQMRQALTDEVPVPPEVDQQLREAG